MFGYLRSSLLPLTLASALVFPSTAALAHGSLHARIESLSERIAAQPDDKRLYVMRAELQAEHGELRAAQADLARARRIDPTWSEVDLVLARCLLSGGKLEQARVAIAAFRARDQESLEGLRVEAEVMFGLKRWAAAESLYVRYVRQAERPEPDHYLRAAEAISRQGKAHVPRALSLLDEGVVKFGDAPVLRERAIQLAMQAEDHEAALQRVGEALAVAHHAERWFALRGDILARLGQREQAQEAYRASLAAIAQRSEARRQSRAMMELRQDVEANLARLTNGS